MTHFFPGWSQTLKWSQRLPNCATSLSRVMYSTKIYCQRRVENFRREQCMDRGNNDDNNNKRVKIKSQLSWLLESKREVKWIGPYLPNLSWQCYSAQDYLELEWEKNTDFKILLVMQTQKIFRADIILTEPKVGNLSHHLLRLFQMAGCKLLKNIVEKSGHSATPRKISKAGRIPLDMNFEASRGDQ